MTGLVEENRAANADFERKLNRLIRELDTLRKENGALRIRLAEAIQASDVAGDEAMIASEALRAIRKLAERIVIETVEAAG